jgi:hypothetical protein
MDAEADSIGQLQSKILEAAELMLNGIGLAQRDAAPVRFGSHTEQPPLSAPDTAAWLAQRAAQAEARTGHARALARVCGEADRLAQALPERRPIDAAELLRLQEQLAQAEQAVNAGLARAATVVKRLREDKEEAMRAVLLKGDQHPNE